MDYLGLKGTSGDHLAQLPPAKAVCRELQKLPEKDITGAKGRQGGHIPAHLSGHCFNRDQFWQQPEEPHQCPWKDDGLLLSWSGCLYSAFPGEGVTKEKIKCTVFYSFFYASMY